MDESEIEDMVHRICDGKIEQLRQELQQEIDRRCDELEQRINDLEREAA